MTQRSTDFSKEQVISPKDLSIEPANDRGKFVVSNQLTRSKTYL